MRGNPGRGVALVSVLLLLVTLLVLGLGMQLLALFNLQLARSATLQLGARLETADTITRALLIMEQLAQSGTLPDDAAQLPGVTTLELRPGGQLLLRAVSSERPGVSSEALAGLTPAGEFLVQGRR
jgi:type II secretory pathway component PulK